MIELSSTWTAADIANVKEGRARYARTIGKGEGKDWDKDAQKYVKAATICIDWLEGKTARIKIPKELEFHALAACNWRHGLFVV